MHLQRPNLFSEQQREIETLNHEISIAVL
jgi:hypothetical protein